jgi:hypothetical protein
LKIKGRKSNQQRLDRLSALSQICRRWSKDQKEEKKRKGKKNWGMHSTEECVSFALESIIVLLLS